MANAMGPAMVTYITTNAAASVVIHTTDVGLQVAPTPNVAGTNCAGPAVNKTLSGSVA